MQLTGIQLVYNLLVERQMNQTISHTIEYFGLSIPRKKEAKSHQHTSILEKIWLQKTKTKSRLLISTFWLLLLPNTRQLKNQPRVAKMHNSMENGKHQRSLHTGRTLLSNSKSILVSAKKRRKKLLLKRKKVKRKLKRKEELKMRRRTKRKLIQKQKAWRAPIHVNTAETLEITQDGKISQHFSSET
jgi:hypothetical protein